MTTNANKKQTATSNTTIVETSATFPAAFSNELKALAVAIRADWDSYNLDKEYKDTVNVTIANFVKSRYGLSSAARSGAGYSLLQMYTRVFSANAPKCNYEDVRLKVLPMLDRGFWCLGAIPSVSTATTPKGKTSLPFDRLDIIAAMRAVVDGDEVGNEVVSEWSTLDDETFTEAYTLEILESDSLVSVAIDRLKIAQQAAIDAANAQRLATLKGKKLSFKITPKA